MERSFENKVTIVTGGAKGIGKCICEEFEYAQQPAGRVGNPLDIANMVLYL